MNAIHLWRIRCATDDQWEYVWRQTAPSACPANGTHTIDNTTWPIDICCTVHQTKRLRAANSPFTIGRQHFYRCDTSSGAIVLNLPAAAGANDERTIVVLKETGDANAVTVNAAAGDLIDGAASKAVSTERGVIKVRSDGVSAWTSQPVVDVLPERRMDSATSTSPDHWVYRETRANAVQNGTNVANSWTTRALNETLVDGGAEVSLASNAVTLEQGTYTVRASSTFYYTEFTRMRLYNVTDATTALVSLNASAHADCTVTVSLEGAVTVATTTPKVFRLEYYCTRAQTLNGLGRANGTGDTEVYSVLHVSKCS